jgi:hypothetical protein
MSIGVKRVKVKTASVRKAAFLKVFIRGFSIILRIALRRQLDKCVLRSLAILSL